MNDCYKRNMNIIRDLQDPEYVARFQRFCGIVINSKKAQDANQNISSKTSYPKEDVMNGGVQNGLVPGDVVVRNRASKSVDSAAVLGQTVVWYTIRYKPLHYLLLLASLLGNEPFYLLFYPLFGWNADFYVTRITAVVWCIVMYLGQATKDVIRWPRPSYPPVVNLEKSYILEYGMPSTHAMAGTAMPFTLLYVISSRYDMSPWLLLCVAVPWSGLVCVSRLYLGVHTVGDVIVGVAYTSLLLVILLPWMNAFDHFEQTHPFAPLILLVITLLMCTVLYPKGVATSKADSAKIVAVIYGMTVGVWLDQKLGIVTACDASALPYAITAPTWQWVGLSLLRLSIGLAVLAVSQAALKSICLAVLSRVMRRGKDDTQLLIIYRFITYCIMGILIAYVIPVLFRFLMINRNGFHTEGSCI